MSVRTLWCLTLPALFAAETAGHSFLARGIDEGDERHGLLSHALQAYGPPLLAVSLLLAGVILRRCVLASFRAEEPQALPSWRLAALPAIGFLAQEHLERLASGDQLHWLTVSEPAVLLGVALQLPCGLAAIWLVRALLRAAEQLGSTLAHRTARAARRPRLVRVTCLEVAAPRLPVLASQHAGRAPPAAV